MPAAAQAAVDRVTAVAPGDVVAVEVMTLEEQDRRPAEPPFPEFAGAAEVAEMLGVMRQRLSVLRKRPDSPAPVAELAAGPVWRAGDLSRFAEEWMR